MAGCDICGQPMNVQIRRTIVVGVGGGSRSRGRGNYCMNCMSGIASDINYAMLYKEVMNQRKRRMKPKKILFAFFGHYDIKRTNNQIDFIPTNFSRTYLKKWSKHDRLIIVLLTDSYDEYWNDIAGSKGLYSSLKKVVKKVTIDSYLLSAKFLRRGRSQDIILRHYFKILDDLVHLTGQQDEVYTLFTSGLPFFQDFLQLYYTRAIAEKKIVPGNIFEVKNTDVNNLGNKAEIIEISLKEGVESQAEESLLNNYNNFFRDYLGVG